MPFVLSWKSGEQSTHVAYMVKAASDQGCETLEPTAEAEQAYVDEIRRLSGLGQRFYEECTPGYYNSEGEPGNRHGIFSEMYGAGPVRFFELLRAWRANDR